MTIMQAITQTQSVKPNQYDDEMMVNWLSELDGMIYHEYIVWHEEPKQELETEPEGEPEETEVEETPEPEQKPEEEPEKHGFTPYDPEKDMDTVLIVPEPYSGVYIKYLCAQVDYYNGESSRYANSMIMFNMALSAFADWYNRTHMPKQDNYVQF